VEGSDDGRVVGSARAAWIEALSVYAVATALSSILFHLQAVGFVRQNLHALVAATFLFLPQLALRKRGDLEAYGLRARPVALGCRLVAIFVLGILPAFALGFWLWNRWACGHVPKWVPGSCWHVLHPGLRLPDGLAMMALAQVVVVALPEELFFRGYLMGRLEDALPPTRKILGAPLGWAWLLQAALFGLGHFLVTFSPGMLTRAIPGLLFGWLFARTRSILAGTLFHAACNILMEVLATSLL
jgi:membrane protease YdiL (CAAX protease family)